MRNRITDPNMDRFLRGIQRPIGAQQQQAALAVNRIVLVQDGYMQKMTYSLLANQAVYDGGAAYFDTGSYGTVTGTPSATTRFIGKFFMAGPNWVIRGTRNCAPTILVYARAHVPSFFELGHE